MSDVVTEPEHVRSGPFTPAELRLPLVDRWTPVRLILYPITAVCFWCWLLPGALLVHIVYRLYTVIRTLVSPPSSHSPSTSYVEPLQPTDAVWLHDKPTNHNIITAILVLSHPPLPYTTLLSLIHTRILTPSNMQRLQCTIDPISRSWVRDNDFDLREHVLCWVGWKLGSVKLVSAETELSVDGGCVDGDEMSEEGCSRALQRLLATVVNSPIQSRSGRPSLWSFTLLPGYGTGSVIVFRAHHVIADGVLLSGVLLEMLMDPKPSSPSDDQPSARAGSTDELLRHSSPDATSSPTSATALSSSASTLPLTATTAAFPPPIPAALIHSTAPVPVQPPSLSARARHRLRFMSALFTSLLLGPLHLLLLSFHPDDFNPLHHAHSLSVHKSVHWSSQPVSVHRVKRIGKYYGASVNDVMMCVMVAAIDRATTNSAVRSRSHQRDAHFLVPINVRPLLSLSSSHRLGNLFAVLLLPFRLAAASPRARLLRMRRQMNEVKRSPLPLMMFVSQYLTVSLLPAAWSGPLLDLYNDMCTAILTNNKSPSTYLYCCGRRLEHWISWAPARSRCSCSVTLLSYAGSMRVSVVMDRAVEERVSGEELLRLYEEEFRSLESGVPLEFMQSDIS